MVVIPAAAMPANAKNAGPVPPPEGRGTGPAPYDEPLGPGQSESVRG